MPIEPTAETAVGCGLLCITRKVYMDKCIDYFDQAINLEQVPIKESRLCIQNRCYFIQQKTVEQGKTICAEVNLIGWKQW